MVRRLLLFAVVVGCGGSGPTEGSLPVVNVVVEPGTAELSVGEERQFSARTFAANGKEVFGRSIQWSAGNPSVVSVDGAGRARGVTTGASPLTARASGVSGSATLNVVTNEPAGLTKLLELSFSDPTWQAPRSQGWDMLFPPTTYQNCGIGDGTGDSVCMDPETMDDAGFPNSPVGQHTLPQNFGDNNLWAGSAGRSGGTRMSHTEGRVKEIYASFRVRFDPAISFVGGGGFKILGLSIRRPTAGPAVGLWINATGSSPTLGLEANQKQFGRAPNGDLVSTPLVTRRNGALAADEVLFVEAHAKMNSAANLPDGILRVWVDGTLLVDLANVIWFEETTVSPQWFSGVWWDPIPNVRSPAPENWIRMDDIYASGR
jgi:hypothetical protein